MLFLLALGGCCTVPKPAKPVPVAAAWGELPGWKDEAVLPALQSFLKSCPVLKKQPSWVSVCLEAEKIQKPDDAAARAFFETHFTPYRLSAPDGSREGLITGYYEPMVGGSLKSSSRYRYPVYGVPRDLVSVDLGEVYPELKPMRLRGRLEGRKLVPYYSRAQIDSEAMPLRGSEILWVDDAIDLFFLQIQGSGKVALDTGNMVRIGYADQNGYPYQSIGRLLVERGEISLENASMDGIRNWAKNHPEKVAELLGANPSYVFFKFISDTLPNPPGALGVPLTPGLSLAVDPRTIPLGAPVYLSTTWPATSESLDRLMLAQDTGGAIKGGVRADVYWGSGKPAGELAGKMRQRGKLWVLLPTK
ncbi:MAG: murein transglycosylase A [Burkholderiales bacterium]|nr:murein transglycosylase A [Burkholderiales bacterium]